MMQNNEIPNWLDKMFSIQQSGEVDIRMFFNRPNQSPFAAEWFYLLGESSIDIDYEKIAQIILKKEKEIIQKYPPAQISVDAYTGLGDQSLTSRWQSFNLFKWEDEEIQKLKKEIYKKYLAFLEQTSNTRKKVWVQCWANVLRKGQDIKMHFHSLNELTYLSGHVTIQCDNTSTVYVNPYACINHLDEYYQKNIPANLTFFPSYLPHYTTMHNGSKERISIAFDLILTNIVSQTGAIDENLVLFDDLENME